MREKRVAILGGTSGIGLRVAERIIEKGGSVVLGGRNEAALATACAQLGPAATSRRVDSSDKHTIAAFFEGIGPVDHLFTPGSTYSYGAIDEISDEVAESPFRSKFWGQYYAVKHVLPYMQAGGSIVLMSGAAGARPLGSASAYAACNSAIEGLGRALALELAPLRVNVVAPGTIDSELWRRRPEETRRAAYDGYAALTALKRVGTVDDVAGAVIFLMENGYTTGSTLFPDGGYTLR